MQADVRHLVEAGEEGVLVARFKFKKTKGFLGHVLILLTAA